MLVSSLIAWCNRLYEPDTTTYKILDANWISLFNEALIDLKPYVKLKENATADLVIGTDKYALPPDFYKMFMVKVKPKSTDENYSVYDEILIEDNYSIGYKLWEAVTVQPKPKESVLTGIQMYYYKNHAELVTDTDNIEISNPYLIGLYALGRIETGDRIINISNKYFSQYAEGIRGLMLNEVKPYEDFTIKDVY